MRGGSCAAVNFNVRAPLLLPLVLRPPVRPLPLLLLLFLRLAVVMAMGMVLASAAWVFL